MCFHFISSCYESKQQWITSRIHRQRACTGMLSKLRHSSIQASTQFNSIVKMVSTMHRAMKNYFVSLYEYPDSANPPQNIVESSQEAMEVLNDLTLSIIQCHSCNNLVIKASPPCLPCTHLYFEQLSLSFLLLKKKKKI